ncbi:MAG: lysophospholipid acyltransferase family protein [Bacteroidales bacterium]|nr:lysophospholipid acyltransferase family protein [Bacteroidales bacterium]
MKKDGKIGSAIIFCITRPLAALPLGFHRKVGSFLGWMAGSVVRYRRDVVNVNLSRSFPDLKYGEIADIRKKFYRHFGEIVGEAVWFGGCSNPERLAKSGIGEIVNPEAVNKYKDAGRGVMVMFSHSGNWELLSGILQTHYGNSLHFEAPDLCVSYRALSSKAWDRFIYRNRLVPVQPKSEGQLVESFDLLRFAISHKGEAKMYIFITDQYPYSSASCVEVEGGFLHQKTFSMNGCAPLAKKLGLPLVYLGMSVADDGHYALKFTPICDNAADMGSEEILSEYYRLLEKDIQAQPWNYLWTHKRWK